MANYQHKMLHAVRWQWWVPNKISTRKAAPTGCLSPIGEI